LNYLQLIESLERKDLPFLLEHIDDKIKISFGLPSGKNDFLRIWKLKQNPQESEVWTTLLKVLRLGGKFDNQPKTSFTAPYTFFADNIRDSFGEWIIIGQSVKLRETASVQGKILGLLNYDIVKYIGEKNPIKETIDGETYPWIKIETTEKIQGYVYGKYIRSPIDYRVNFVKKNGKWKITFFVAGD